MLIRNATMAFIAIMCILIPCIGTAAEQGFSPSGVYAFWRGDKVSGEDFDHMRNIGIDGCLLPAAGVELDADTGAPLPIAMNLTGLKGEDTIGLDFHIVATLSAPKAGWRKKPDLTTASMLMGDMCRSAFVKIDETGGRFSGILLYCPDQYPDYAKLAQVLNQLRNNAAFQNLDAKFGVLTNPDTLDIDEFRKLADASDYFALDLTAMDLMGDPPLLIEEDWAVKSIKKMEGFGKPFIAILPIQERVLRHDAVGHVMHTNVPISFDTILKNADTVASDSAANTTAVISTAMVLEGLKIPAGTKFTHVKASPGELAGYVRTLHQMGFENLTGIALDGLPYEPSSYGYKPQEYVSSLKGASSSPAETGQSLAEKRETLVVADAKARTRGLWLIGVLALFAGVLAAFSVLRKKNLHYDEGSERLKRNGENK